MNKKPLEGVKILDFSQVLAAPFCGMMLADLGAQVIKVERPGSGDFSREYGPFLNDVSLYFCQYNRGKRGLAVNMRSEAGKRVIMSLVKEVDIVVENYKAGTLEKLGLGYDEMLKVNPTLIYGSISGFGTHGPLSHLPCMDVIAAARSGLVSQSGMDGDDPIKPGFSLCDTWAGLHLLRGLSMALLHKQKTNKGVRVDIAMLDCAFYLCEAPVLEYSLTGVHKKRTGNHDSVFAPYGEFAANDGHAVIAVTREEDWPVLCGALGLDSLKGDPRFSNNEARLKNIGELISELEAVTSKMGRFEIEEKLSKAGISAAAVRTVGEFVNDPQTKEIGVIAEIHHPGVGDYLAVNTPIRFSKTPVAPIDEAPSHPGEHSREILANIGYSQKEIDELLESGAVYQPA